MIMFLFVIGKYNAKLTKPQQKCGFPRLFIVASCKLTTASGKLFPASRAVCNETRKTDAKMLLL